MELLFLLDVSSDGRTDIVVIVLWIVAYSTMHITQIKRRRKKKRDRREKLSLFVMLLFFYGKFFLSRYLANKQRLDLNYLRSLARLLITIFFLFFSSCLVTEQIIVHTRRRSGNSCRRAIPPSVDASRMPPFLHFFLFSFFLFSVSNDSGRTVCSKTIEFLLH